MKSYLSSLLLSVGLFLLLFSCNSGTVRKISSFDELPDPTADTLSDWSGVPQGLHASFVSTDAVFRRSVAPDVAPSASAQLEGWRGERVSAQLLLWTASGADGVEVKVGPFRSDGHTLSEDVAQARFVRYVLSDEFGNKCGYHDPTIYPPHLVPDMLDDIDVFDIKARNVRPVWITISVPADTPAGEYVSTVKLFAKGQQLQTFDIELTVIGRELPPPAEWNYYLDLWQHPAAVARIEGLDMWSDAHFEALVPYMQLLADAGQKVVTTTLNKDPWNNQCFDSYADMIVWTKNADGAWSYDYTVFDRWVELMTGLGIDHTINCYSMLPWNNELHYRDGVTGRFVDVTADPGTPAFEELWVPFLTDFTGHLREKGWLGRTNIAMDERSPEEMTDALDLLRKTAPELGIAMADNKNSYLSYPFINSMCVKVRDRVPPKHIAERRAQGFVTTYYVCCSDRFPNMFTFSDPAEAVYAGWYTAACGYDGFLRWAYNSWVGEPLTDSRFRTFPAGDTYIIYPGARSSVRFERLVEGIQDAEKISILKKEFAAAGTPEAASRLEQLETLLAGFASITPEAGWPDRLSQSKRTLNELSH